MVIAQCGFIPPLAYYLLRPFGQHNCDRLSQYIFVNFASWQASDYHSSGDILIFVLYVNFCGILCHTFSLMLWGVLHVFGWSYL